MVTKKTADANDGYHNGRSDAEMGGLVTRRCACGDCNGGKNAWGRSRRRRRRYRCRRRVFMNRSGLHVTVP